MNPPSESAANVVIPRSTPTALLLRCALPPLGEGPALVEEASQNSSVPIGANALLKCCVVELPLPLENCFERSVLALSRKQAEAVGEYHPGLP